MPSFDFDFEVYCDTCGDGLCNQSQATHGRTRGEPQVRVGVCKKCLDEARDEEREKTERAEERLRDAEDKLRDAEDEIARLNDILSSI